jgi:hypothetical protein
MTAHSPVGKNPEKYGVVKVGPEPGDFANNDLWHDDPQGCDHELFGAGLSKAIYNYMHGIGLEEPLQFWFDFKIPRPTLPRHLIAQAVTQPGKNDAEKKNLRVFWLGNVPELAETMVTKKGRNISRALLSFQEKTADFQIKTTPAIGTWLCRALGQLHHDYDTKVLLKDLEQSFPAAAGIPFSQFMVSPEWLLLREKGLLIL